MGTILLISPYWRDQHRWMVSSVKLAELWQRMGYRVVVVCMGQGGQSLAQSAVPLRPGESVEQVSSTLTVYRKADWFLPDPLNFGIALGFSGFVRRVLAVEQPNLVIANKILFWSSFSIVSLRWHGYRVQALTDALVGITWWPRSRLPGVLMALGAWTMGWLVLRLAERVVFFHPQPASILRRLGIAAKSRVIPTGIDPGPYRLPKRTARSECAVTYVGRLESVKGADDFIAAALAVKESVPGLRIRIAGWARPGHPLVERHRTEIEFLGLRDDIAEVLAETDVFVLPSYSEGLSNALMEAMSSATACIASDVGGNRFLIQNGVSGLLFPPGDREALAAHIRRLVEDVQKRNALAIAGSQRIDEIFAWSRVETAYARLFAECVGSGEGPCVSAAPGRE